MIPWLAAAIVLLALLLWPPTPRAFARLITRAWADLRVLSRAKRNRTDFLGWIVRRPALMSAINGYEAAVLVSNSVDPRLKNLASLRASSLAGCPF
ncbi:MAG: hypothetical protein ACREQY_02590 [Candidatus Binatia bacterium]